MVRDFADKSILEKNEGIVPDDGTGNPFIIGVALRCFPIQPSEQSFAAFELQTLRRIVRE